MRYVFEVAVDTDSRDHALQVMAERIHFDEEYADRDGTRFDYEIQFDPDGHFDR